MASTAMDSTPMLGQNTATCRSSRAPAHKSGHVLPMWGMCCLHAWDERVAYLANTRHRH